MPEKKVSKLFKILEENMIKILYPAKPNFRYKEYKHIRSQRIIFLNFQKNLLNNELQTMK